MVGIPTALANPERVSANSVVIGGGLAGLVAAYRLSRTGRNTVLVDMPPVDPQGGLGGFARFSGAKFSLPPAGLGLLPIAGSHAALNQVANEVLALLGLAQRADYLSSQNHSVLPASDTFTLRAYQSLVLRPDEVDAVLSRLQSLLESEIEIVVGRCTSLSRTASGWMAGIDTPLGFSKQLESPVVIYAGGRSTSVLLRQAGAQPQIGKGLDVGFRIEFQDKGALTKLRSFGPDAKIIKNECRTFCLNYPGEVFRYEYEELSIPGGVVAHEGYPGANVGILCRVKQKPEMLSRIRSVLPRVKQQHPRLELHASDQELSETLTDLYGANVSQQLVSFSHQLVHDGLIRWSEPHIVHVPLVDWHWDVYAEDESFATTVSGLHVIGDSSGHARGLLQAAMSGWLVADTLG